MVDAADEVELEFDGNFEDSGGLLSCLVAACDAVECDRVVVDFVECLDLPVESKLFEFLIKL